MAKLYLEFHSPVEGKIVDIDRLGMGLLIDVGASVEGHDQSLLLQGDFDPAQLKKRITELLKESGITFTDLDKKR